MKITPYDTGKVQIGLYYERPRTYTVSLDMERLQTAYIGKGVERDFAPLVIGLYVVALMSLALFWVCR